MDLDFSFLIKHIFKKGGIRSIPKVQNSSKLIIDVNCRYWGRYNGV